MPSFSVGDRPKFSDDQLKALISFLRYNAESNLELARRGRELYGISRP
jgi:cytochrome c1